MTARRQQIEAMLREEPDDSFLRYALAMEHSSEGNTEESVRVLMSLIESKRHDPYIPAYLMAGQGYLKLGREAEAIAVLKEGIAAAKNPEHSHARGEMQGLLDTL